MNAATINDGRMRHFHVVDLIRFAAAMLVIAYHYGASFARAPGPHVARVLNGTPAPADWASWTWSGWIGVEIFFVISGFVIAISAQGTPANIFLRRRVLRLFPAAWICATLTFATLAAAVGADALGTLFAQWSASVAFSPFGTYIDESYWTLGIELGFYLMVAAVIGATGEARRIERAAIGIGGMSTVFWAAAVCGLSSDVSRLEQVLLLQHGCFFALGIVTWRLLDDGVTRGRCALFAVMLVSCLIETAFHARFMAQMLNINAGPAVPLAIFAVSVALLLASRRLQPVLAQSWLVPLTMMLGLMTYPLYLIHQDAGAVLMAALLRSGVDTRAAALLTAAAAIAAAWAIARHAEPWLRARLRSAMDGSTPQARAASFANARHYRRAP